MVNQLVVSGSVIAVDWSGALLSVGGALGKAIVVMVVVGVGGFLIDSAAKFIKNRFLGSAQSSILRYRNTAIPLIFRYRCVNGDTADTLRAGDMNAHYTKTK